MGKKTSKNGWTKVAFGDVVRHVKDTVDPHESGLERYIAGQHMDTDDLRIRRWGLIGNDYLGPAFHMRFKPGQVLYGSRRTYLRKVALADFAGITANTTYVLESKDPNVLLPELLPFIMQTESFHEHSIKQSKGSVNPYINFSDIAWYEFQLPSLQYQEEIYRKLRAADQALEAARNLVIRATSIRESWVENQLQSFAKHWPIEKSTQLLSRTTVGIVVKPADLYVQSGTGVPALRSLNVVPYDLVMDELINISKDGHEAHYKSRLDEGDVVVVRSGRPGDAVVIPPGLGALNCIDLIIATPGDRLLPYYLCAVLNSRFGRRQFLAGIAGTAQKHFNVGVFKNFEIPVPPIQIQQTFSDLLSTVFRMEKAVSRRFERQSALKALIVQKMLQV